MPHRRRDFLGAAAMAGGAFGLSLAVPGAIAAAFEPAERAATPLRILILRGTGFIGPARLRAGICAEREVQVLAGWRARGS